MNKKKKTKSDNESKAQPIDLSKSESLKILGGKLNFTRSGSFVVTHHPELQDNLPVTTPSAPVPGTLYYKDDFEDCVIKVVPGGGTYVKFKGMNEFKAKPE